MKHIKEYNRFRDAYDSIERFFRGEGEAEQATRRLDKELRNSRPTTDERPLNAAIPEEQMNVITDRSAQDILADSSISDEELNKIFQRAITYHHIDIALELMDDPRIDPSLPYTERITQNNYQKGVTDYAGSGNNGIINFAIRQNFSRLVEKLLRNDKVIDNFKHIDKKYFEYPAFLKAAKKVFELETDEDVKQFIAMMK